MQRIIDKPQACDMGHGSGHIEMPIPVTLEKVLNWLQENAYSWGVITIYNKDNKIIRRFDFDLYNNSLFYHHLNGWHYTTIVKEVKFNYCFMSEDIDIYLT